MHDASCQSTFQASLYNSTDIIANQATYKAYTKVDLMLPLKLCSQRWVVIISETAAPDLQKLLQLILMLYNNLHATSQYYMYRQCL